MLQASAHAIGWRSALLAAHPAPRRAPDLNASAESDFPDDEREPFHLDDPELALRLVRKRGLTHYRTPPHTHLVFPLRLEP